MQLDRHYSVSDDTIKEMSKKSKKEILEWLRSLPVHRGISVEIRENKLLVLYNDIKQLKPKTSKRKPSGDTGADAKDSPGGYGDKEG